MHWQLATLAIILLGFAAISARIEGTWITAPMVFTAAGLVVGVEALGLVDPSATGSVLAPTHAALGQAVVTSPRLPARVRQSFNVESGLNDGICVPLFFVALAVALAEDGAIGDGAASQLVLEKIGYGVLGGVVAGVVAAAVVVHAGARRFIDATWLQVVPLAGALLGYGLAEAIGGSGFIAAFIGGMVFGGLRRHRGGDVSYLMEQTGAVLAAARSARSETAPEADASADVRWRLEHEAETS